MQKVDVNQLRQIAKVIILSYLKDKKNLNDKELIRVEDILDIFPVETIQRQKGSAISGLCDDKKITFEVSDEYSYGDYIVTLIHEFFHKIIKTKLNDKIMFVEEGIVSFATAEAISNILKKEDTEFLNLFEKIVDDPKSLKKTISETSLRNRLYKRIFSYKMQPYNT